ncbi:hypothetical protein C8R44DRAFT_772372 [Mycena epipterygia]|nr:hypothetical protein C8R44DRAFT_772372 [Mycena epipterygia]
MTTLFPSLRTLTIGQDDNGEDYSYNPRECVEMLCAAPDLVECTFTGIFHRSLFGPPDAESMFTHPCLKHLSLDGRGSVRSGIKILQYLVLPALESLSISYFDIPYDDFLAFLTRSSPPLQSLRMIVQWRRWTGDMLEGILRFVPSLTELYLSEANTSPLLHSPLDVPALVSSELLPKLRRLTISWEDHPPQYAQLVSALHLWRASGKQIPSLRVICSEQNEPDVDIRAALQQFVVDGLDIYIGPES